MTQSLAEFNTPKDRQRVQSEWQPVAAELKCAAEETKRLIWHFQPPLWKEEWRHGRAQTRQEEHSSTHWAKILVVGWTKELPQQQCPHFFAMLEP